MQLGLVGTGRDARLRADCYERSPDARVVGTVGIPDDEWPTLTFGDVDELLATDGLDAVDVCDPTVSQCDVVDACLAASVGVVCRTPLAADLADAAAIRDAAGRSDAPVLVDALHRFAGENRAATERIDDGDLGTPTTVRTTRSLPSGVVDDGSPGHSGSESDSLRRTLYPDVARARFLFGDVERVFTRTSTPESSDHRHTVAIARFASGAVGHLEVRVGERYDRVSVAFEYSGTNGRISYDTETFAPLSVEAAEPFEVGVSAGPHRSRPSADRYERHADHVLACLSGEETPVEGVDEAIETLRTVEAVLMSARRDEPVPVAEVTA